MFFNKIIYDDISLIINIISNYFLEDDLFNMYYEKLFENRILSDNFNLHIEKKLINNFKKPKNNSLTFPQQIRRG